MGMQQRIFLDMFFGCVVLALIFGAVSSNVIGQKDQDILTYNEGLYNATDQVVVLDVSNFKSSVYNSKRAWLVEFYNSWCGFCQRFAHIWKSVAKNVHGWRDIVAVAAINCANDDNNPLCREYEVMRYPTLKFFHINANSNFLGLEMHKDKDEELITNGLIDQLEKEQQEQRGGDNWPNIVPYWGTELDTLWHGAPTNVQYEILIFDEAKSYLGAQVILDLHKLDSIRIRRVSSENVFLVVTTKVTKFPTVIVLDKSKSQTVLKIDSNTRNGIREAIIRFLKSKGLSTEIPEYDEKDEVDNHKLFAKQLNAPEASHISDDKLYLKDLEGTLRYSLNNEIPLSPIITGEKLIALKTYLKALVDYFPTYLPKTRTYLQIIKEIVENKNNITGKDFKKQVKLKETDLAPVYSGPKTWIGCKGSSSTYRGYPCGLWTLFHTLTVAAAEDNDVNNNQQSVLLAMHGYIKNFFGCGGCSEHFQEMSKRRKLTEVPGGDDSILWLWRAHNEVNERLAGDETEDPEHKKIQYPAAEHCPTCKLPDGKWDENEVLSYLKSKYNKQNIDLEGISDTLLQHEKDTSALSSASVTHRKIGWDFTIFDISICVVLYVASAAILTLVCIKFAFKRTYKKKISFQNLFAMV